MGPGRIFDPGFELIALFFTQDQFLGRWHRSSPSFPWLPAPNFYGGAPAMPKIIRFIPQN